MAKARSLAISFRRTLEVALIQNPQAPVKQIVQANCTKLLTQKKINRLSFTVLLKVHFKFAHPASRSATVARIKMKNLKKPLAGDY